MALGNVRIAIRKSTKQFWPDFHHDRMDFGLFFTLGCNIFDKNNNINITYLKFSFCNNVRFVSLHFIWFVQIKKKMMKILLSKNRKQNKNSVDNPQTQTEPNLVGNHSHNIKTKMMMMMMNNCKWKQSSNDTNKKRYSAWLAGRSCLMIRMCVVIEWLTLTQTGLVYAWWCVYVCVFHFSGQYQWS